MNSALIFLLSPIATAITKIIVAKTGKTIAPQYISVISALWGAIANVLSKPQEISLEMPLQTGINAIEGAVAGFGGSKGRDLVTGKTVSVKPE